MRFADAVAVAMLFASPACRSKPAPVPPPAAPLEFDDEPPPQAPATDAPTATPAADAGGCKAGGTAWDGKHEGCLYEVAGCCYGDAAAACAAAGCDGDGCQILESAPAQVACRAK
ncbi:MAG: hypothetical protein ACE37F_15105 [Nannocystaceae bacterium]|nr:hypothetical protein [bacterium]